MNKINKNKSTKEVKEKKEKKTSSIKKDDNIVISKKETKKKIVAKNKKDYFSVIFISVSITMFLILIFSLVWFKNSLFLAKDMVEIKMIKDNTTEKISPAADPFLNVKNQETELIKPIDNRFDPILGEDSAEKVKLFYFSDFNCSFCFEQEKIIKDVFEKYKEKMVVVWKDYPDLKDVNSFSYQAARAARCAQNQNNFWSYSDLLYKEKGRFSSLKNDLFLVLAGKAGLNLDNFLACMNDNNVDSLILNNVKEAEDLGILGIPYIYVNDKDFLGNLDEDELSEIIEMEINEAE